LENNQIERALEDLGSGLCLFWHGVFPTPLGRQVESMIIDGFYLTVKWRGWKEWRVFNIIVIGRTFIRVIGTPLWSGAIVAS